MLVVAPLLSAEPVERPASGGRHEPAARVWRRALDRPALEGDDERLAGRVLGDIDVTEAAHQRGDHAAVLLAEGPLDRSPGSGRDGDRPGHAPRTRPAAAPPGRGAPRSGSAVPSSRAWRTRARRPGPVPRRSRSLPGTP